MCSGRRYGTDMQHGLFRSDHDLDLRSKFQHDLSRSNYSSFDVTYIHKTKLTLNGKSFAAKLNIATLGGLYLKVGYEMIRRICLVISVFVNFYAQVCRYYVALALCNIYILVTNYVVNSYNTILKEVNYARRQFRNIGRLIGKKTQIEVYHNIVWSYFATI